MKSACNMSVLISSIATSVMLVSENDVFIMALHRVRSLEMDGGWSRDVGASVRTVVGVRVVATSQRHSAK